MPDDYTILDLVDFVKTLRSKSPGDAVEQYKRNAAEKLAGISYQPHNVWKLPESESFDPFFENCVLPVFAFALEAYTRGDRGTLYECLRHLLRASRSKCLPGSFRREARVARDQILEVVEEDE